MSETGNGRKNWTRVVAAVGLVFLAVAGGLVLANANKVINKTEKKDEETPLISIGFSQVGAESEWRTGNSISTKTNAFCLGIILCNVSRSFDYLIYPYYPAYTS